MKTMLKGFILSLLVVVIAAAALIGIYAPMRARNLEAKYTKFRAEFQSTHDAIDAGFNHHERIVNGIKWHYVDEGAPKGRVILFLHGLPEGWYSWRYILPLIDANYRLIAIDMKGYGRSDLQDKNYDWHHVARQTVELMDALDIRTFFVVGHDWGSLIGSVLVHDHPARIRGFVRMEADLIPKTGHERILTLLKKPQWILFRINRIATYLMRDPGFFIDRVYKSRMVTSLKKVDRDYLVYEFSRPGVAQINPTYFNGKNWDLDTAIGEICKNNFSFPVLQLQADRDPAQPPSLFTDVSVKCPNVRMEWINNASHFDNFDQPRQVADAINRFVNASK
ncbi:MAG: alpha/beta hydrolase [Deltaproteobacteria bacterium]|nr:alpha/beta hydrolase [Deltaproteobacteria bacterium]